MAPRKRTKSTDKKETKAEQPTPDETGDTGSGDHVVPAPGPGIPYRRMLIRLVLVVSVMFGARFYFGPPERDHTIVRANEFTPRKFMAIPCSTDYKEDRNKFKGCVPTKCGRVINDNVVSKVEANHLRRIAQAGLAKGVANGGAAILDLHSGALTQGEKFINIYAMMNKTGEKIFTEEDFHLYRRVKNKIHNLIAQEFGIPTVQTKLYLTKPTFFSRMTTKPAQTIHDEYWHPHVDKVTYGSFHYTSLLYLSTYGDDFTGGRFVFVDRDANRTVEPRLGRVSFFTSGSENEHYVEKLEGGVRYAITISFTCDPAMAISDPKLYTKAPS